MNTIWHRKPNLSEIKKMSKKTIDEYLGIEITEVGDDFLAGKIPVNETTSQPY